MESRVQRIILAFIKNEDLKRLPLFERAKRVFGTTNSFRTGAWLLPDGSVLDLSDTRSRMEHSTISRIFTEDELKQDFNNYMEEDKFAKKKFMEMGAIRLAPESGSVEMRKEPTSMQLKILPEFLRKAPFPEIITELHKGGDRDLKSFQKNEKGIQDAMTNLTRFYKGLKTEQNKSLLAPFARYANRKKQ